MTIREKTQEQVANEMMEKEERMNTPIRSYKIDANKLSNFSYEAIAKRLNELFGVLAVDISDGGVAEKMFLDGPLGDFLTVDEEKVDILQQG